MDKPQVAVTYRSDVESEAAILEVLDGTCEVVSAKGLPDADRQALIKSAQVFLSLSLAHELSALDLERAKNLRLLQLMSAGVDHVDLSSVPQSVVVASNVGAYAGPMAEHVMAMTLSLAKRLSQRHAGLAAGKWEQYLMSLRLDQAVCAIVGFGGIGKATARLMRAFGAKIWAINSTGSTDEDVEFAGTLEDLDAVLTAADVVVICLPLTRTTRGLIGERELQLMKPNAILVNVARGDVIDEKALYEHLRAVPEFSAGIDTWWREPRGKQEFRTEYPFFDLPNLVGSPHNSPLVPGILVKASRLAAENVLAFLEDRPIRGVVRREDYAAD